MAPDSGSVGVAGRWLTALVLAVLTWRYARMPLDGSAMQTFLHLPDLVFHEAGHVLFSPFGRFMTVLGGSLTQLLVPVVCAVAFLRQHHAVGAAVCAWWVGQNLIDLAPYIADARALRLPLLGGATGAEVEGHDWEYLLATRGWLRHDVALARAAQAAGTVVMVVSVVGLGIAAGRKAPPYDPGGAEAPPDGPAISSSSGPRARPSPTSPAARGSSSRPRPSAPA